MGANCLHATQVIVVGTGGAATVRDITAEAKAFVSGRGDGLLQFRAARHRGLAIIETGAGSEDDLLAALETLLPADDRWRHRHG